MKERFWNYMDSAKGFITLLILTIIAGIGYMFGIHKLINWAITRRQK